jgi:hypothetical protein
MLLTSFKDDDSEAERKVICLKPMTTKLKFKEKIRCSDYEYFLLSTLLLIDKNGAC